MSTSQRFSGLAGNNTAITSNESEESIMSLSYWTARPWLALSVLLIIVTLVLFLLMKYTNAFKGTRIEKTWQKIEGWFSKGKNIANGNGGSGSST